MRATHRTLMVVALAVAINAAATDPGWVWLRGNAIKHAFSNQDFGDGIHFANQFMAGGELRGMNMGKPAKGHWRVTTGELCWQWMQTKEPEECYRVLRKGQDIRLFLDDQEVLSGSLTPLPSISPR